MEDLKIKNKFKAIVVGCGKIGFGNKKYLIDSHAIIITKAIKYH